MTDVREGTVADTAPVGARPPSRLLDRRRISGRLRIPPEWRERTDWVPLDTTSGQVLRGLRLGLAVGYPILVAGWWAVHGVPFDRSDLLLWVVGGLACACVGRHPVWLLWVLLDLVPFASVLVVYDYLRGWADTAGMPTWWHPQIDLDTAIFGGVQPTVWLQEHLEYRDVRWYDVLACACYFSFFFLPYITAGVMWLRGRRDFYRWTLRFVSLSFFGYACFVLFPTAPPWAAARCRPADVAAHPHSPACMAAGDPYSGGLLGTFTVHHDGVHPYVQRIVTRGFAELHLDVANTLLSEGRVGADAVAAVPSLHLGGTVLFVLFVWRRVSRWWRPVLVAYPLLMTLSLVYTGEHYVIDCLLGALAALLVHVVAGRVERRRAAVGPLVTLGTPP